MSSFNPIRGMHDRLPDACKQIEFVFANVKSIVERHGYQQILLPLIESTELFKRSVGVSSDIVQKEMYTFEDRNQDTLTLRPEGTAGCYRSYLEHYHRASPYQRLWYYGPMYRRERPQKGRQREFYQFGIEAFGFDAPYIDVEIVQICHEIFSKLPLSAPIICKINYLGSSSSRASYLDALRAYFKPFLSKFDDVHNYRYEKNVLRLLDSKDEYIQSLIKEAPKIVDFLPDEELSTYKTIKELLTEYQIPFEEDNCLVRGLDYYSGLIFEFQAVSGLGAQNTICAGGRTDQLCEILSGKPGMSLGMAIGMERLCLLLPNNINKPLNGFIFSDQITNYNALRDLQSLLDIPTFIHYGISQLKKQLNRAEKMNYDFAIGMLNDEWQVFDLSNDRKYIVSSIHDVRSKINECRL